MENKSKKFMVILSFLPIFMFPVNLPMALFLTVTLAAIDFVIIKDQKTLEHALKPIIVILLGALFFLSFNFAWEVIDEFGGLFNNWWSTGLRRFLSDAMDIIYILTLLYMILFTVLSFLSIIRNKETPFISIFVKSVMAGKMVVSLDDIKKVVKQQANEVKKDLKKKKPEAKDEEVKPEPENNEEEVVVEEPKE